jgi:hypothetical protein
MPTEIIGDTGRSKEDRVQKGYLNCSNAREGRATMAVAEFMVWRRKLVEVAWLAASSSVQQNPHACNPCAPLYSVPHCIAALGTSEIALVTRGSEVSAISVLAKLHY